MRTFITRTIVLLFLFSFCWIHVISAATFTTVTSGNWNDGATWGNASPGVVGVDFPGAGDDAIITGGFTITIVQPDQCRNLLIDANSANIITYNFSGTIPSLTVNGTMAGWNVAGSTINVPLVGSQINSFSGIIGLLTFTGSDINGIGRTNEIIYGWNNTNQINVDVDFNLVGTRTFNFIVKIPFAISSIDFGANVLISNGILQNGPALVNELRLTNPVSTLTISGGAQFSLSIPISMDGTNRINQITNNGTITSSSFINATTFNLGSGGILNTSYNGTEGWWSGTNRPTTFSINDASTINYNSSTAQNIYATQYGNLQFSSSTKTLGSTGNLEINGNLLIGSSAGLNSNSNSNPIYIKGNLVNNGTWSPNNVVNFDDSGSQLIGGTGSTLFNGGLIFGDGFNANTVGLTRSLSTTNILIQPSSTFSPSTYNVTISGNWTNNGTLATGTATTTFNGASVLEGSANTLFNNVVNTGTVDLNSSTIAFKGLTNNGTINCDNNTMSVRGSFTNNGTFNRGTGTVVFNGTGTQNVSGSSQISFHNLTISNTTPSTDVVNFNSMVNLYNILTLNSNGHIDADGTGSGGITLISGDNGTAKIGPIGASAVFDGNITTQRRIVPGTTGWRFISTPLRNQTLASWSDDFNLQGVIGGPSPSLDPVVFYYNETLGTGPNNGVDGWVPYTNVTNTISNTGIRVYFFASQLAPTLILDNTGPPVVGDGLNNTVSSGEKYTINLDFTGSGFDGGGWNLVENPYPCEIDYESVISSSGLVNVNNGIYVWNPTVGTGGNYGSYVGGVSTNGVERYVASGQSFFVKANATGASISYLEGNKVTNQGNTFIREGEIENVLKIKIASEGNSNFDEMAVRFRAGSGEQFESEFDAYKLANGWINISSITDEGLDLSINTLGEVKEVSSVKLRVAAWAFGDYTISFSGLESFAENVQFRLVDKYLNESVIVDSDAEYTFQVLENIPETYGDNRFELQVYQKFLLFGDVATYTGVPVSQVLINAEGDESMQEFTDDLGAYAIETFGETSYSVSATKSEIVKLNTAVTTLDIIATRRHLLKIKEFDSPYQVVSADVNFSKSLTVIDLLRMRLVVLGFDIGFKDGVNWLFVPEVFDLTNDPFNFDTKLDVSLIDQNQEIDFVAVKIGDVDNSWEGETSGRKSNENIELDFDYPILQNDIIEIPLIVKDFNEISGYQFSITWDPSQFEYQGVEDGILEGYFNEQNSENGVITTMWDDVNGRSVKLENGSVLFILRFKSLDKNADSKIELNSTITQAVAFNDELNSLDIKSKSINVNLEELRNGKLEMSQNVPNPFEFETFIEFQIPKAGKAKLSVINMLGEVVYNHEQDYQQGIYRINWNKNQGSRVIKPGVYIYRLESNGEAVVKKMLIK